MYLILLLPEQLLRDIAEGDLTNTSILLDRACGKPIYRTDIIDGQAKPVNNIDIKTIPTSKLKKIEKILQGE